MRRRREAGSQKRSKASGCQVSGNPPLKSRQHTQAGQMRYDVNTAFAGEADDPGRRDVYKRQGFSVGGKTSSKASISEAVARASAT